MATFEGGRFCERTDYDHEFEHGDRVAVAEIEIDRQYQSMSALRDWRPDQKAGAFKVPVLTTSVEDWNGFRVVKFKILAGDGKSVLLDAAEAAFEDEVAPVPDFAPMLGGVAVGLRDTFFLRNGDPHNHPSKEDTSSLTAGPNYSYVPADPTGSITQSRRTLIRV
jgi:hypothetical protein